VALVEAPPRSELVNHLRPSAAIITRTVLWIGEGHPARPRAETIPLSVLEHHPKNLRFFEAEDIQKASFTDLRPEMDPSSGLRRIIEFSTKAS